MVTDQQSASLAWSTRRCQTALLRAAMPGTATPTATLPATVTLGSPISGTISPHQPFVNLAGIVPGAEQLFEPGCVLKTWSAATVEDWFPNHARSSEFWRGPSPVRKDIEARKHTASWSPGERRPTVPRRRVRGTGPAASTIVTAGLPEPQGGHKETPLRRTVLA